MNQWVFLFMVAFIVLVPNFINSFDIRNAEIASCERVNEGSRVPFFQFVSDAEANRRALAAETTGQEAKQNLIAAENYADIKVQTLKAVEEYAIANGSPVVDCPKAFPKPWPF